MRKLAIGILFLILLSACENNLYKEQKDLGSTSWSRADKVEFVVDNVEDVNSRYNLYVELRHASFMSYGEVLINAHLLMPNGKTVNMPFLVGIRNKEGELLGEALGDLCDTKALVYPNFEFPQAGRYVFTLTPAMEADPLAGVMAVGLTVEKNK